jgi:RNA polymerase sigma-70 factor, ECF subfamily
MVEADARLGVVKKTGMNGKAEVSRYFGNSSTVDDCRLVRGLVEGYPPSWCSIPIFRAAEVVGQ